MDSAAPLHRIGRRAGLHPGASVLKARLAQRHLRVRPWHGDPFTALIGPARSRRQPSVSDIERAMAMLADQGVAKAVTPALNSYEAEPFFQAGFGLYERLHLLSMDLTTVSIPPESALPSGIKLGRGRRWHRQDMLDVDAAAFRGFWQFDAQSLAEAVNATPHNRVRLARLGHRTVAYVVTGRANRKGYLQRLAVEPAFQGRGIGSALVHDSSRWLQRNNVTRLLVNTQETNTRALDLYERLGFTRQHDGLVVLRWDREG